MTCQHRNVTAIPGGRYACTDTLNCEATFSVTSGPGEVDYLRARVIEGAGLIVEGTMLVIDLTAAVQTLTAQRDSARDCAVILEQLLAEADEQLARRTSKPRLDTEKWNPPKVTRTEMAAREQEFNDACPAGSTHEWRRFKDGAGGHTKCLLCGIRRVEDGTP